MKREMLATTATFLMAAGTMAGCAGWNEVTYDVSKDIPAAEAVITEDQAKIIKEAYDRAGDYWDMNESQRPELKLLQKQDKATCEKIRVEKIRMITALNGPAYCRKENVIAITGLFTAYTAPNIAKNSPTATDKSAVTNAGLIFATMHEYSHAWQFLRDGENYVTKVKTNQKAIELEADELAARSMCASNYSHEVMEQAKDFVNGLQQEDETHDTRQARVGAFVRGAQAAGCKLADG